MKEDYRITLALLAVGDARSVHLGRLDSAERRARHPVSFVCIPSLVKLGASLSLLWKQPAQPIPTPYNELLLYFRADVRHHSLLDVFISILGHCTGPMLDQFEKLELGAMARFRIELGNG
jgi:hypothetical protein